MCTCGEEREEREEKRERETERERERGVAEKSTRSQIQKPPFMNFFKLNFHLNQKMCFVAVRHSIKQDLGLDSVC